MMTTMTRKRNQRRKRNTKKESKVKVKVMMSHIRRRRCVASAVILFKATVCERDGKAYKKNTF